MGMANIILKNGRTLICSRGATLTNKETADLLINEVTKKNALGNELIRCENGGGFFSGEVVAITVPSAQLPASEQTPDES